MKFSKELKYRTKYNHDEKRYYAEMLVSYFWGLFYYWTYVPFWSKASHQWVDSDYPYLSENEAIEAIKLWQSKKPENPQLTYKELL